MLEFGTENTEINQYSNLAPFVISIEDNPDNQLLTLYGGEILFIEQMEK